MNPRLRSKRGLCSWILNSPYRSGNLCAHLSRVAPHPCFLLLSLWGRSCEEPFREGLIAKLGLGFMQWNSSYLCLFQLPRPFLNLLAPRGPFGFLSAPFLSRHQYPVSAASSLPNPGESRAGQQHIPSFPWRGLHGATAALFQVQGCAGRACGTSLVCSWCLSQAPGCGPGPNLRPQDCPSSGWPGS